MVRNDWQRGEIWSCVLPGAYGKPRPVLVIQNTLYANYPSVTVLPLTRTIMDMPLMRYEVEPSLKNGLRETSQIMIDKINSVPSEKMGDRIGVLSDADMLQIDRLLAVFVGIAA